VVNRLKQGRGPWRACFPRWLPRPGQLMPIEYDLRSPENRIENKKSAPPNHLR